MCENICTEGEREREDIPQPMAHQIPSPSTVPVPIAVPNVAGVSFNHVFVRYVK